MLCALGHHGTVRFIISRAAGSLSWERAGPAPPSGLLNTRHLSLNQRPFRFISPVVIAFPDRKVDDWLYLYLVALIVDQTQYLRQRFPDRSQGGAHRRGETGSVTNLTVPW